MSRAEEHVRRLAQLHQRPLPPAITYGRQRGKRIPLKGNQFLRPDPYDIPVHEDDEPPVASRHVKTGKIYSTGEPDPEDSPLSEDELEAVYGREADPLSSRPRIMPPSSRTSDEDQRTLFGCNLTMPKRRTIPQSTPGIPSASESCGLTSSSASATVTDKTTKRKKRVIAQRSPSTSHKAINSGGDIGPIRQRRPALPPSTSTPDRSLSAGRERPGRQSVVPADATRATDGPKTKPSLPVNELLLVTSLAQANVTRDLVNASPSPKTHEPIVCNSPGLSELDPDNKNQDPSPVEAPLTLIRKRIKTPKPAHKSVVALRKKQEARAPFFKVSKHVYTSGDGFETTELKVTHPAFMMKKRRAKKPLTSGISALTLRIGPLPNVDFATSSAECKQENSRDDDICMANDANLTSAEPILVSGRPNGRPQPRRWSSSVRELDEDIALRLSSVSAPRRVYSISSDDDEEYDEGEDDWLEPETERCEEAQAADCVDYGENSASHATPDDQSIFSQYPRLRESKARTIIDPACSTGVDLDFRKFTTPGAASKASFNQRHLMEVDEVIDDVPDTDSGSASVYLRNVQYGSVVPVTRFLDQDTPIPHNQPRSILRRTRSIMQEADTGPEHTAANTRRNSFRAIEQSRHFHAALGCGDEDNASSPRNVQPAYGGRNTEVTLDDHSHYFSNASDKLRDRTQSKPRIVKQRSSEARRASYHNQPEVHVPDSDDAVLETSTAVRETSLVPPDHTTFSELNILKRTDEATWSSRLPKVPRDLKSLTRSVSREHGTLSQSVRRRPGLPFQSPVKVR